MAESSGGTGAIVAIFGSLIGLAVIAVIVSQRAQTSSILQALGSAAGTAIGAATAPVTGSSTSGASVTPIKLPGQ
jgi:hypothetical protein